MLRHGVRFTKNTILMPFYADILRANFFDLKNSRNRRIDGDLEPLKDLELFFLVISLSDIFKLILEND
jgi:hypothetical protein